MNFCENIHGDQRKITTEFGPLGLLLAFVVVTEITPVSQHCDRLPCPDVLHQATTAPTITRQANARRGEFEKLSVFHCSELC